jgi:hypothetical protein
MVRTADAGNRDALAAGRFRQPIDCKIERRIGKAVRRIDGERAGAGRYARWCRKTVDLA